LKRFEFGLEEEKQIDECEKWGRSAFGVTINVKFVIRETSKKT